MLSIVLYISKESFSIKLLRFPMLPSDKFTKLNISESNSSGLNNLSSRTKVSFSISLNLSSTHLDRMV